MEKLLVTTLLLCIANFSCSQYLAYHVSGEKLEAAWESLINHDYLDRVQDRSTPELARVLEDAAASYDIESHRRLSQQGIQRVMFTHTNGSVVAIYDHQGKILRSYERFKTIRLPQKIVKMIIKKHPGWTITGGTYQVWYRGVGKKVSKSYRVVIQKGKLKKVLRCIF